MEENVTKTVLYCFQLLISLIVYCIVIVEVSVHLLYYLNGISLLLQICVYKLGEKCQLVILIYNIFKTYITVITLNDDTYIKLLLLIGLAEFLINLLCMVVFLPKITSKVTPIRYNNKGTESCSICLENFVQNAKVNKTVCNHIYHEKCIDNWLDKHETCPNCRTTIL